MDIRKAAKALDKGAKIKRKHWNDGHYLVFTKYEVRDVKEWLSQKHEYAWTPQLQDLTAGDWQVIK